MAVYQNHRGLFLGLGLWVLCVFLLGYTTTANSTDENGSPVVEYMTDDERKDLFDRGIKPKKLKLVNRETKPVVTKEAAKIMKEGGSLLTLTYESTKAIPNYNVMGVCKSALEASVKYLARDLGSKGMRVNAISAGPIKTLAASAIGDAKFLYKWNEDHSFLKRNVDIHDVGNSALYLLSDLAAGVTGEIHYVDAGYNKVGMPDPKNIT